MKNNIVDHGKAFRLGDGMKMRLNGRLSCLPAFRLSSAQVDVTVTTLVIRGYGPYYGPAPYYGGPTGSVVVEVGDRPYYRGPDYWSRGIDMSGARDTGQSAAGKGSGSVATTL
jgi:hypothetical protein